jgi:hypothetical protein
MEFIGFVSDLRSRQPIQYMERLYKHQEFLKTMNVEVHVVDTYNDSPMKVKYNIHYILSHEFGRKFRKMCDDDVEDLQYALDVVKMLNMKENDIDWDYCLKKGIQR